MGRIAALLLILAAAFSAPIPSAQAQRALSEQDVKATFLYRFASFVTWPSDAFPNPQERMRICIVGADPFGALITRAAADQSAQGRTFEVDRLTDPAAARRCHIVYAVGNLAEETLHAVHGLPVLTVTDASSGGGVRGIIHFVVVDDRVRFHVDEARAAESNLAISSRLLSVAVSVRRRTNS